MSYSEKRTAAAAVPVEYDPFAASAIARTAPSTEAQREIWLSATLGAEASLAYNESISLRFTGDLDRAAMGKALQALVDRHDALRTAFTADGLTLVVSANQALDVPVTDFTALEPEDREPHLEERVAWHVSTVFDLARGPLVRAEIVRLAERDHVVILTAHHIVCDGWSFWILTKELAGLYAAYRQGLPPALAPAESFAEFAAAQAASGRSPENIADEAFWLSRFSDEVPVLDLPTDRPRPALKTYGSRREDYLLDAALLEQVRKAGARCGASVFATLLAGFKAMLFRLSGQGDVVVGIPAAGQAVGGHDALVGHCVNVLPLRSSVHGSLRFDELVKEMRSTMLDAYDHQNYTYGTLLSKLPIERDPSRLPIVSILFNIDQALAAEARRFEGLTFEFAGNARQFENFEIFVNAMDTGKGLRLECQYNTDLYDPATLRRWMSAYESLLRAFVADPAATVGSVDILPADDQARLARWNETAMPYPQDACVHDLVADQVAKTPDAVAVVSGERSLTYSALAEAANRLARRLRKLDVGRGSLVGLCVERTPEMVIGLLGILESGAAYVPLDPGFPQDRLELMTVDSGMRILVTTKALRDELRLQSDQVVCLDDDADALEAVSSERLPRDARSAGPEDVAYVIYTSGSSGMPKGVQVPHRAVVNFLVSMKTTPGLGAKDRLVAVTTLSFDIAVLELQLPLVVGGTVVLAARDVVVDGEGLRDLLVSSQATVMQATPTTWRLLVAAGWRGAPGFKALVGGEAVPRDVAKALLDRATEVWNMYGPTETTVWSTCWPMSRPLGPILVGRPIANTQIHVLDDRMHHCLIGVAGDVWIGGDGVTLGYLHRPELTADRFVPDPFRTDPGALLYKTGDQGRLRPDGNLECLGRNDLQVKVRGYRIELGEVEAALGSHPAVIQAVVLAREDRPGDVRLVGYVVLREGATADPESLRTQLSSRLPEYMIPSHFVTLETLPLLPNGKLDRKSLPAPGADTVQRAADFVLPRTDLERVLAAAWQETLGLPRVSVLDDFFRLGGHSLLAAQMVGRLSRDHGLVIPLRSVFASPTIERLALTIAEGPSKAAPPPQKPIQRLQDRSEAPATAAQERLWFLEELNPGRVTYNAPSAHRLRGPLDERAFARAFAEMMRRQPVLRTSFEWRDGALVQRIQDDVAAPLFPAEDLSALPAAEREVQLGERLQELANQTIELTTAPLFKARLFRLGEAEHALFFMPHHIVWDGWSFDLFYEEMSSLYAAFVEGGPSPLPELSVTFGDFAAWHRDWITGSEYAKQLAFWRGRLETMASVEDLPTDMARRPGMSGEGDTEWITLDKATTDGLHRLSQEVATTMFVTTLAAYAALLYGYSGQKVLLIGTPVRGRNTLEVEPIMGFFNNLVPLQLEVDPAQGFKEFMAGVMEKVVEGFAYPDVPLEVMSHELAGAGGRRGAFLYQALFSFQDGRQRIKQWGNLAHEFIPLFQKGATEDLGMWFLEGLSGMQGGVTYNTDILTAKTAQELRRGYGALLAAILRDPSATVGRLVGPQAANVRRAAPQAAPAPHKSRTAPADPGPQPSTETEKLLATIWCERLKVAFVSTKDNFFDLGGHSLLAMQAILEVEQKTGKVIDRGRYIFESLGQIARAYDEAVPPAPKTSGLKGLFSSLLGGKKSS